MLLERVELAQRDLILLVSIVLGEEGFHVLDEGAGDGGRQLAA